VESLQIVDHPAVADRLTRLRDAATPVPIFRRLVEEVGIFLAYEATRSLATTIGEVATPVGPAPARRIASRPVVAPILRASFATPEPSLRFPTTRTFPRT
jgi:uracil phosphoribosyltransferase